MVDIVTHTLRNLAVALLVVAILLTGCRDSPSPVLTKEQQVYESLFLARVNSFSRPIYIAGASDSQWFVENPIDRVQRTSTDLGRLVPEFPRLLAELYRLNEVTQDLDWRPIVVNGVFLPASHASNPRNAHTDERCFDASGEGSIEMRNAEGRRFRPYYTVSRVVFTANGEFALVKFGYHCAPLSGAGESLLLFKFQRKRWILAGSERFQVS
jgi:hypothetical protein